MNIVILGAGAMGCVVGGRLAQAGHAVSFIDVAPAVIEAINAHGVRLQSKDGSRETFPARAAVDPAKLGPADLVIVFVKCYHTVTAVSRIAPLLDAETPVLSLQNGWGNGERIAQELGPERLLLGVSYYSATTLEPGLALQAGVGKTFMGEPGGTVSPRLRKVAAAFAQAGFDVEATDAVLPQIWKKLALNAVTLPTSAITRVTAERLLTTPEMADLMRALLAEVVSVARAESIPLDHDERWQAITGLLSRLAPNTKGSMLQDVERGARTEIDVINGAIVAAGARSEIPTPHNATMVALVKAAETAATPRPTA